MFIPSFFITDKIWKQPQCPSTDEWKKNVLYMYNGILLSFKSKNEVLPFEAMCMDLGNIMLDAINQIEEDQYCISLKSGI